MNVQLDWLQQELNKRAEEFQITTRSKIMIGNWNMNAQMPDKIDIDPWINPGGVRTLTPVTQ